MSDSPQVIIPLSEYNHLKQMRDEFLKSFKENKILVLKQIEQEAFGVTINGFHVSTVADFDKALLERHDTIVEHNKNWRKEYNKLSAQYEELKNRNWWERLWNKKMKDDAAK